jgi:hypothetical protein
MSKTLDKGLPEVEDIQLILLSITQMRTSDEHFQAVQVVCEAVREVYLGLLDLIAQQRGLAAQALARTLFQTIVSGVVLVRNPEKLEDFRRHGKYTQLRTLHFSEFGLDEKSRSEREELQTHYASEIDALYKEFGEREWHKLATKEAFIAAGFKPDVYDKYYRPASAIAHGQPHAIVTKVGNEWKFGRSNSKNAHHTIGTYVIGGMMLMHFLSEINQHFKLGIQAKLEECNRAMEVHKESHYSIFRQSQKPSSQMLE